ncbi:MAG: methyltransferase domain-containing protein [Bdellovibrionales bacterium]|nr:methyltransferase domain-containing protein [Bdellovibrionales bacterium]
MSSFTISTEEKSSSTSDVTSYAGPDVHSSSLEYAARFSGAIGKWLLDKQLAAVKTILEGAQVKTILDIGGGHAQIAPYLIDMGYEVVVLGSASCCSLQLSSLIDQGKIEFRVSELTKLPFQDKSIDAVICLRQICHLENWRELSAEAHRVAKQMIILDYPPKVSFNALYLLMFPIKKWFEGNTRTFKIFSHSEVRATFESNGWRLHKKFPQFFLPIVMHRALKRVRLSEFLERICYRLRLTSLFGSPVIVSFIINNSQL